MSFVGGRHATGQRFDGMPEPAAVAFEENLVSLLDEVGLVEAGLLGEGGEEVAPGDADGDAVGGHELAADHDVVALGDTEAGSYMGCGGLGSDLEHLTGGRHALVLGLAEVKGPACSDSWFGGNRPLDDDVRVLG